MVGKRRSFCGCGSFYNRIELIVCVMQTASALHSYRCRFTDTYSPSFFFFVCFSDKDCSEVVHWHDSIIHHIFFFFGLFVVFFKCNILGYTIRCTRIFDRYWESSKRKMKTHSLAQWVQPSAATVECHHTTYFCLPFTHFNGFCCKIVAGVIHRDRNFYCRATTHLYRHHSCRVRTRIRFRMVGNIVMCNSISDIYKKTYPASC